jgi:acyl-CoA thioester hydrolase
MEAKAKIRVRYQETDQMGVVYHANYLVWFEVGRSTFIREQGYSYQQFEQMGLLLPVVEAHAVYRAPARYDEEITVVTRIAELGSSKIVFEYEVIREADGRLLATGYTKHVWVNKEMKRVNIAQQMPELYEKLLSLQKKVEVE